MFDARPEDREQFAVYILDIEIDHKADGSGGLVPFEKITLGKKGAPNWQSIQDVRRLEKDNPALFAFLRPTIEKWRQTQELSTDGHPVEAWPVVTKAQIKQLRNLGLRSVEDVASATDSIREKYGMGFLDLKKQAQAFLSSKQRAAVAKQITDYEAALADMKDQLAEAQRTIAVLAEKAGMVEQRPALKEREAA